MQVPVFTIGYTAASASNSSCRDATGFPLPSTGRGIEGEGWLYLKLPFLPFMQKNSQNPRNITFYALKQESTTAETSRPHANPWAVGRVTPCAPLLTSKPSQLPLSQCFPLKKHIMQVPVFTTCYARRQRPQFIRPRRPWWTKSRCDSVCLRSRHFVAWLRRGLAHDAIAIQTTQLSQCFTKLNA